MWLCRTCRDRLSDHNLRRRKRVAEAAPACAPMIDPAVLWQTTPANAAISRSGRAASRHLATGWCSPLTQDAPTYTAVQSAGASGKTQQLLPAAPAELV